MWLRAVSIFTAPHHTSAAAVASAISTGIAAWIACKANSIAKNSLELNKLLERNRITLIQNQLTAENLQQLIYAFAEVQVIAKGQENVSEDERRKQLMDLRAKMKYHIRTLIAFDSSISGEISAWKDSDFSRIVCMSICAHGSDGSTDKEYFERKMKELKSIQKKLFQNMAMLD